MKELPQLLNNADVLFLFFFLPRLSRYLAMFYCLSIYFVVDPVLLITDGKWLKQTIITNGVLSVRAR